jgi:chromosome segregation ATPase
MAVDQYDPNRSKQSPDAVSAKPVNNIYATPQTQQQRDLHINKNMNGQNDQFNTNTQQKRGNDTDKKNQRDQDALQLNQLAMQAARVAEEIAEIQRERAEIEKENALLEQKKNILILDLKDTKANVLIINGNVIRLEAPLDKLGRDLEVVSNELLYLEDKIEECELQINDPAIIRLEPAFGEGTESKPVYKAEDGSYYTKAGGLREKITDPDVLKQIEEKLANGGKLGSEQIDSELESLKEQANQKSKEYEKVFAEHEIAIQDWQKEVEKLQNEMTKQVKLELAIKNAENSVLDNKTRIQMLAELEIQKKETQAKLDIAQGKMDEVTKKVAILKNELDVTEDAVWECAEKAEASYKTLQKEKVLMEDTKEFASDKPSIIYKDKEGNYYTLSDQGTKSLIYDEKKLAEIAKKEAQGYKAVDPDNAPVSAQQYQALRQELDVLNSKMLNNFQEKHIYQDAIYESKQKPGQQPDANAASKTPTTVVVFGQTVAVKTIDKPAKPDYYIDSSKRTTSYAKTTDDTPQSQTSLNAFAKASNPNANNTLENKPENKNTYENKEIEKNTAAVVQAAFKPMILGQIA